MKKISFVILTWNSDKYITNCIESINTICNFCTQITIVDNGSTDNIIKILKPELTVKMEIRTCNLVVSTRLGA